MNEAIKKEHANSPTAFRSRLAGFAYADDVPSAGNPGTDAALEPKKESPSTSGKRPAALGRSARSSAGSGASAAQARKITARRTVSEGKRKAATPSPKKRTSTKERSANDVHSPPNNLVDSLRPGLTLVMIGLNPGLETARTGITIHESAAVLLTCHRPCICSPQQLLLEATSWRWHHLQAAPTCRNTRLARSLWHWKHQHLCKTHKKRRRLD